MKELSFEQSDLPASQRIVQGGRNDPPIRRRLERLPLRSWWAATAVSVEDRWTTCRAVGYDEVKI
jgi:hypothetical protein